MPQRGIGALRGLALAPEKVLGERVLGESHFQDHIGSEKGYLYSTLG